MEFYNPNSPASHETDAQSCAIQNRSPPPFRSFPNSPFSSSTHDPLVPRIWYSRAFDWFGLLIIDSSVPKFHQILLQNQRGNVSPSCSSPSSSRGSLSPLTSTENLETLPSMSPPVKYATPVKIEEDVLVMDGIPVKSSPRGGGNGNSSKPVLDSGLSPMRSELCNAWEITRTWPYGSKCQVACKTINTTGSHAHGTKCLFGHYETVPVARRIIPEVVAKEEEKGKAVLLPARGAAIDKDLRTVIWFPMDDNIPVYKMPSSTVEPHLLDDKEQLEAQINSILQTGHSFVESNYVDCCTRNIALQKKSDKGVGSLLLTPIEIQSQPFQIQQQLPDMPSQTLPQQGNVASEKVALESKLLQLEIENSKFAHGKEDVRPNRQISSKSKSDVVACKTFTKTGSCEYGTKCRLVHYETCVVAFRIIPKVVAKEQEKGKAILSPARGASIDQDLQTVVWSPMDDNIPVYKMPSSSAEPRLLDDKEQLEGHIRSILYGPSLLMRRLPVVSEIYSADPPDSDNIPMYKMPSSSAELRLLDDKEQLKGHIRSILYGPSLQKRRFPVVSEIYCADPPDSDTANILRCCNSDIALKRNQPILHPLPPPATLSPVISQTNESVHNHSSACAHSLRKNLLPRSQSFQIQQQQPDMHSQTLHQQGSVALEKVALESKLLQLEIENSKFAHGKEDVRPNRQISSKSKSDVVACKTCTKTGSCAYGTKCRLGHYETWVVARRIIPKVVAKEQEKGKAILSPARGASIDQDLQTVVWSPMDDNIPVYKMPSSSAEPRLLDDKEQLEGHIRSILYGPSLLKRRLPVFSEIYSADPPDNDTANILRCCNSDIALKRNQPIFHPLPPPATLSPVISQPNESVHNHSSACAHSLSKNLQPQSQSFQIQQQLPDMHSQTLHQQDNVASEKVALESKILQLEIENSKFSPGKEDVRPNRQNSSKSKSDVVACKTFTKTGSCAYGRIELLEDVIISKRDEPQEGQQAPQPEPETPAYGIWQPADPPLLAGAGVGEPEGANPPFEVVGEGEEHPGGLQHVVEEITLVIRHEDIIWEHYPVSAFGTCEMLYEYVERFVLRRPCLMLATISGFQEFSVYAEWESLLDRRQEYDEFLVYPFMIIIVAVPVCMRLICTAWRGGRPGEGQHREVLMDRFDISLFATVDDFLFQCAHFLFPSWIHRRGPVEELFSVVHRDTDGVVYVDLPTFTWPLYWIYAKETFEIHVHYKGRRIRHRRADV